MAMRRYVLILVALGLATIPLVWNTSARAANEAEEMADHLIDLVKIGRVVVSEYQDAINDVEKADKGFTGEFVADQVVERFKKKTKIDLRIPNVVPNAHFYLVLVETEREVIAEAQPVINKQGIGFKGFSHAVFARRVGERFYMKTGVRMKLTGFSGRALYSKPDDFEQEVLRMFSDPRHPRGQRYARNTLVDGRPVLRVLDPEYATDSCLSCHGSLKGERDIMGIKKEGWKEGAFAGAISVVLPLRY